MSSHWSNILWAQIKFSSCRNTQISIIYANEKYNSYYQKGAIAKKQNKFSEKIVFMLER